MQNAGISDESSRIRRGLLLLGASLAMSMTPTSPEARQRPFPVVAVQCDAGRDLCQALVQALSEMAPTHLYRINPSPLPSDAFELRLEQTGDAVAHLRWQDGGAGADVVRTGLSDTDLAARLVAASPNLPRALKAHQ